MCDIQKYRYDAGDTEGWLKIRKSLADRVGGSEIGAIAGHSPYRSAFASFCEKCGAVKAPVLKKREAIIQGHDGEQGVADRFEREMGLRVHKENSIMTNSKYPHLKASVDRLIYGRRSGLECKTAQDMAMKKYKHGDFPMAYFDQCMLYLAVTGYVDWYLAIQVFGTSFRLFMMTLDKSKYARYTELKDKFAEWEMFKAENYLEWTYDHSQKRFVWEGDVDSVDEAPELLLPEGLVNLLDDPDLTEWEDNRWGKLEAMYLVDQEELDACEQVASLFIGRVEQVKAFMAGQEFEGEAERMAALSSAVRQVWPADELDGSAATADAVRAVTGTVAPDSVDVFDESSELHQLVAERAEIAARIKELESDESQLDAKIEMSMGDLETAKLAKWKVTYKMGAARETASASAIKAYFASKGAEVPAGILSLSTPKRSLRFWEVKEKAPRKSK